LALNVFRGIVLESDMSDVFDGLAIRRKTYDFKLRLCVICVFSIALTLGGGFGSLIIVSYAIFTSTRGDMAYVSHIVGFL
jgi:hypothetical protein